MLLETETLVLPIWAVVLILIGCIWIISSRQLELILGIYCSQMLWALNVQAGPIALTWILVGTLLLTWLSRRGWERLGILENLWLWMIFWGVWSAAVLLLQPADPQIRWGLARNLVLYIALPMVTITGIDTDSRSVKLFAQTFIFTTVVGAISIILVTGITADQLLRGDFISLYKLGRVNYHMYTAAFLTSAIYLFVLAAQSRNWLFLGGALLGYSFLGYMIFLSGSRQAILVFVVVTGVLIVWQARKSVGRSWWLGALIALTAVVMMGVAQQLQGLATVQSRLSPESLSTLGTRTLLWSETWSIILKSPILGSGHLYYNLAHNLFLEAWLTMGLPGLLLIVWYVVWVLYRYCCTPKESATTGDVAVEDWRMATILVFGSALLTSMVVGNLYHGYALYWGGALMFMLTGFQRVNLSQAQSSIRKRVRLSQL